ncbi:MAG: HDOD domain-containing protein [Candidatus Delongbacteria bacterium]
MNEIITLGKISDLIEQLPQYPKEVNDLSRSLRSSDLDLDSLADYILDNKTFYDVFCNFNPAFTNTSDDRIVILEVLKKLDVTSLRNILFACSILSLDQNDISRLFLTKTIMSSYICRDIIDKVNQFRKTHHNPENFFLYCLFHDIGEIFAAIFFPERVKSEIYKDQDHINLEMINDIVPHNEIGYMMARKWNIPSIFSYICLNHNKLEYRKFTSEFIYIINAIAVSDAVTLDILGYDIPYTNTWDVGHSIYKIGLRESDIYTESGLIGTAEKKLNKILNLFNLK